MPGTRRPVAGTRRARAGAGPGARPGAGPGASPGASPGARPGAGARAGRRRAAAVQPVPRCPGPGRWSVRAGRAGGRTSPHLPPAPCHPLVQLLSQKGPAKLKEEIQGSVHPRPREGRRNRIP